MDFYIVTILLCWMDFPFLSVNVQLSGKRVGEMLVNALNLTVSEDFKRVFVSSFTSFLTRSQRYFLVQNDSFGERSSFISFR